MLKKVGLSLALLPMMLNMRAYAVDVVPGANANPDNFLDGYWQGQATYLNSSNLAFSALAEAGPRNYRANGTIGIILDDQQKNRIKISGEYLQQDIDFLFFSGISRQWEDQTAGGITYQYYPGSSTFSHFDLGGYYSYTPSNNLPTISGSFVQGGNIVNFIDVRRIANTNADGGNAGFTVNLWSGAQLGAGVNYDDVVYDFDSQPDNIARGFGGGLSFKQYLGNFKINALAENRTPFDDYQAGVAWLIPSSVGEFSLGVNGGYVDGKHLLPDTGIVGVSMTYLMDAGSTDYSTTSDRQNLRDWATEPALYMPQVLADCRRIERAKKD